MFDSFFEKYSSCDGVIPHRRIRIKSEDGLDLQVGIFEPDEQQVKDVVVFFHGAGAHMSTGYLHLGKKLYESISCCAVILPDIRGHGRSGGARGMVSCPQKIWRDIDSIIGFIVSRYSRARIHIGGHSMGASLSLNWVCNSILFKTLRLQKILSSLTLLAPYTGITRLDKKGMGANFITKPDDNTCDILFRYDSDLTKRTGIINRYQSTMFKAFAADDFSGQLQRVLNEFNLSTFVLLLIEDELFDIDAAYHFFNQIAVKSEGLLKVHSISGTHLGGILCSGESISIAINSLHSSQKYYL